MTATFPKGSLGHAALTYAQAGWPVFPCKPGSKAPATRHGFKDASTRAEVIEKWWQACSDFNIAMPTGVAYDVLDVDVRAAGSGYDTLDRLIPTGLVAGAVAVSQTRNGGQQWFYPTSGQRTRSWPKHFLDLKAAGGYVVLPPSRVPADEDVDGPGRYSWLEFDTRNPGRQLDGEALARFLAPPRRANNTNTTHRTPFTGPGGGTDGLKRWLSGQGKGNRNKALFWAARRAAQDGGNPDDLLDVALGLGLTTQEASATIGSARRWADR